MKIFGYELTIRKEKDDYAKARSRYTSKILSDFDYDRPLWTEGNYYSLLQAYRSWVFVCANKNATSFASVPLRLYSGKEVVGDDGRPKPVKIKWPTRPVSDRQRLNLMENSSLMQHRMFRKSVDVVEITDHPFLEMMNNVNGFMNSFSLWELTELFQELCGNAYWYVVRDGVGTPVELWPIMPHMIKVIPDREKFIKGYLYESNMNRVNMEEKEVVHFKFPSPTSLYYGRGPLAAITDIYAIEQNMNRFENAMFANMGRLDGAFETAEELNDVEFERLKKEIRESFYGVHNVGKSPLLEKGVSYKNYGFAPKELNHIQGRAKIKEAIVNAFGQSMGMYDKDATRANAEVATFMFMRDTIKPRCLRAEQKLNEKLIPQFDPGLWVAFDDCVPENREVRLKEIEAHLKSGYSTPNEERRKDNIEDAEWGDKPILPGGYAPLGSIPPNQTGQGAGQQGDATEEELAKFVDEVVGTILEKLGSQDVVKRLAA